MIFSRNSSFKLTWNAIDVFFKMFSSCAEHRQKRLSLARKITRVSDNSTFALVRTIEKVKDGFVVAQRLANRCQKNSIVESYGFDRRFVPAKVVENYVVFIRLNINIIAQRFGRILVKVKAILKSDPANTLSFE